MPEELKKMMSRQASAEREKRATITKAEGDKEAAVNLALAAKTMAASPGAMQLRTLQTIDGLGPTASNTVVLAVPIDVLESLASLKDAYRGRGPSSGSSLAPGVKWPVRNCGRSRATRGARASMSRASFFMRIPSVGNCRQALDRRRTFVSLY